MGIIYKNGTYYGGGSGGGGAEITIDNKLSSTSENPVQNKVIKAELDNKQDVDDLMTSADMDDVVTPLPGVASRLPRYSAEEQIVGYWIDGKPLYQKTISTECPVVTSGYAYNSVSIASLNCDKVIKAYGIITDSALTSPLPFFTDGGNKVKFNINSNTTISIASDANYCNNKSLFLTLQYTKTTD